MNRSEGRNLSHDDRWWLMEEIPRKRRRRTTAQLRAAILDAAQEAFSARGYAGTTTREVARIAGVSEALVYTQFGSKPGLFDAAVVGRYEAFVAEFTDSWERPLLHPSSASRAEFVHSFVCSFFDFMSRNRELCLTYLEYHRHEVAGANRPVANFAAPLRRLEEAIAEHGEELGLRDIDVQLTVRAIISMVLGLALHDEVLFAGMRTPGRARLTWAVADLVLSGIEGRQPPKIRPDPRHRGSG
ncbi:TetR/AcrR family transcriptional regulator [Sporichthya polymorpha]|uniref:TetR/AcrR family transcriptional regulator n=1 Tax=Sporichthya polymorpha TaxID=35751 RepID=UPI00035D24AE|nr:TetR/AcrR family transcriptional regulator [Sporichthya polymorpha]